MGISTITAARIFAGQLQGDTGKENRLSFEQFPAVALSRTYNTNQQTPDSAGTMTAIITEVKTKAGLISTNQNTIRSDCRSSIGQALPSFLEQAEGLGLATGIVTTTRITHATPAATFAHSPERNWENDTNVPSEAKALGCQDIASQLIDNAIGDGINVVFGGGRQYFVPESQSDPQDDRPGARADGRNLTQEWQDQGSQNQFIWNASQLKDLDIDGTGNVLGLFSRSHMDYHVERDSLDEAQPNLPEMTSTAIKLLQRNDKGFFLMVEAGRIDHAHHDLTEIDTELEGYHQETLVPLDLAAHAGEDVAIFARGPWAHLFSSTHEQNYIYHVMRHAAGFDIAKAAGFDVAK
jgi:alkaline phosphatase